MLDCPALYILFIRYYRDANVHHCLLALVQVQHKLRPESRISFFQLYLA